MRKMVPSVGGLVTRPVKFGRKDRHFKHGQLKLRKNKRNQRRNTSFKGRRQGVGREKSKRGNLSTEEGMNARQSTIKPNSVVPQDSYINVAENAEERLQEMEHKDAPAVNKLSQTEIDEAEAFKLVVKLWQLEKDYNIPVAKVLGTTVTDTDIRSLDGAEWLTDNVIDCYLKMLATWECDKGTRVLHLNCSTVNQIVAGTYQPRSFNFKLSDFKVAIGVYNRGSHWMLIVAAISTGMLFFYNPVEEHAVEMETVLAGWRTFIELYKEKSEDHITSNWTVTTQPHAQQVDSYNCGVYCLIVCVLYFYAHMN